MKIELYPTTIETYMTWSVANRYCDSLGDGWRLPTKDELISMFNNNGDKFGNYGCWGDRFNLEYHEKYGIKRFKAIQHSLNELELQIISEPLGEKESDVKSLVTKMLESPINVTIS